MRTRCMGEKAQEKAQQNSIYVDIDFLRTPFMSTRFYREKKKTQKYQSYLSNYYINTKLKCDEDTDCDRSVANFNRL